MKKVPYVDSLVYFTAARCRRLGFDFQVKLRVAVLIHYHGMPTGLTVPDNIKVFSGRHIMVSFANPQILEYMADHVSSFVLDNGAYSFWKSGTPPNWEAYADWVTKWREHPAFDWAIIPDIIDGDEKANDSLAASWHLPSHTAMPVYHIHESLHRLNWLISVWGKVALGSSGQFATPNTKEWHKRMYEVWQFIPPGTNVHGLKMLHPNIVTNYPLKSADSTTAGRNCGLDKRWSGPFSRAKKSTRTIAYCEYLESFQSPTKVIKVNQEELDLF